MSWHEGVTLCMLTAMSLVAFPGLRHPVKLLWLSVVALSQAPDGGLGADTRDTVVSCSLVVILAVTPWSYVWRTYVVVAGDRSPGPCAPSASSCERARRTTRPIRQPTVHRSAKMTDGRYGYCSAYVKAYEPETVTELLATALDAEIDDGNLRLPGVVMDARTNPDTAPVSPPEMTSSAGRS